jgi:hypothetical protein
MNPTRAERIATFDALRVAFETRTAQINASYEAGLIDVQAWQQDMQEQVKIMHVQAYAAGRGGKWADITQREWGAVGQKLRVQYDYLRGFAREVQQGNLSPAQMQARINLYSAAARQQFEAALSEAKGLDASALPAQPGDGTTQCRCIVSPWSRVMTLRGWVPISLVHVGDYVLTHMQRWRRVTHVCVKKSDKNHELIVIKTPGFGPVLATQTHRWELEQGWADSVDIYNSNSPKIHVYGNNAKELSEVRYGTWKSEQERILHTMLERVQLWESERLQSGALYELWAQQEREKAMGQSVGPEEKAKWFAQGWHGSQNEVQGYLGANQVGIQARRAALRDILERWQEANDLPLSVALDAGERPNTKGISYSPQERHQERRQARKPGDDDPFAAHASSWIRGDIETMEQGCETLRELRRNIYAQVKEGSARKVLLTRLPRISNEEVLQLQSLWGQVYPASRSWQGTEVLHAGMLKQGTTLYDITVEGDHSFVIEGMYSHNTNCKCRWAIRKRHGTYHCTWRLGRAEHCSTCLERSRKWKNLRIKDGVMLSDVETINA